MKEEIKYKTTGVTVVWKPNLCTHSCICWKGLPEVFKPKEKPWVHPDNASAEKIIEQVKKCPSGALSYLIE